MSFADQVRVANAITASSVTFDQAVSALTLVHTGSCTLFAWDLYNSAANSAESFVQFFDAASVAAVTLGTTAPKMSKGLAKAGGGVTRTPPAGVNFVNGIVVAATTTRAGSTAPANAVNVSLSLQPNTIAINAINPATATVGSTYSQALSSTGGSGTGYVYNIELAYPCDGRWVYITPAGVLTGTPENIESNTLIVRVTDSAGNTATSLLTINVVASGALALSTTVAGTIPNNGFYAYRLVASGGKPPYNFTSNAAQPWQVTPDGWLEGTPTSAGAVSINVTVHDSANASASGTVSFTVGSSSCIAGIDNNYGLLRLPDATAGQLYQHQLRSYGGAGNFTLSGAPSWLSCSAAGVLTGTPPTAGNVSFTVNRGALSATALLGVVFGSGQVARPSYNSAKANGFFVSNGLLFDPNGSQFIIRGVNRGHFDSFDWSGGQNGAATGVNACRTFYFYINNKTTAQQMADAVAQDIANGIVPILCMSYFPDGTATTGNTSTAELTAAVNFWVAGVAAFVPYMNQIIINLTNEWGPTNSSVWQSAYTAAIPALRNAGYTGPIMIDAGNQGEDLQGLVNFAGSVQAADPLQNCIFSLHCYVNTINNACQISSITTSGGNTVITLNNSGATHPFCPAFPGNNFTGFAAYYISGVQGLAINGQHVSPNNNNVGGTSGSWTVTLQGTFPGSYTSGGLIAPNDIANGLFNYQRMAAQLSAMQAAGLCCVVGELGPGYNIGAAPTVTTPRQIICALEGYGIGHMQWAWDDNNQGGGATSWSGWFGMTLAGPGSYTPSTPSGLTQGGMDAMLNPRYGITALAQPAAVFA